MHSLQPFCLDSLQLPESQNETDSNTAEIGNVTAPVLNSTADSTTPPEPANQSDPSPPITKLVTVFTGDDEEEDLSNTTIDINAPPLHPWRWLGKHPNTE